MIESLTLLGFLGEALLIWYLLFVRKDKHKPEEHSCREHCDTCMLGGSCRGCIYDEDITGGVDSSHLD